jgi:hypothetical protein
VAKPVRRIPTKWSLRTYDVWGNAKDGYDVNDTFSAGTVELKIPVHRHNVGTPQEFESAYPTDAQIRAVFGLGRTRIETNGDDLHITIERARDGYPIGEMMCESHESLSPIREAKS